MEVFPLSLCFSVVSMCTFDTLKYRLMDTAGHNFVLRIICNDVIVLLEVGNLIKKRDFFGIQSYRFKSMVLALAVWASVSFCLE